MSEVTIKDTERKPIQGLRHRLAFPADLGHGAVVVSIAKCYNMLRKDAFWAVNGLLLLLKMA